VYVGGADTQCSLLGAGAIESHDTGATLGTTMPVQTVMTQPIFDPEATLWAGCHVLPDRWVLESNAGDTGDAYLWLLELVTGGLPRHEMYALGERLAHQHGPSPTMLFIGPSVFNLAKLNPRRPGGIFFPFPAMHIRPDRSTLVRGFLENLAFALRGNLEQLSNVTSQATTQLSVSGGMSRSDALIQTIADVIGVRLRLAEEPESAALGCAILVAGAGNSGIDTAVSTMVRHREIEPDPERHEQYDAAYRKWCELNSRLDDISL
jgi:autoinducer 2 (AI-2) kinase